MTDLPPVPVFDGHNDMLLRLWMDRTDPVKSFVEGRPQGHMDLPRARKGGFGGGIFAINPPSPSIGQIFELMKAESYDLGLPDPLPLDEARSSTLGMAAEMLRLACGTDTFAICTTVSEIRAAMAAGKIAGIMHIEGADGLDTDFETFEVLYAAGLRSIGPVWSRPTAYGAGVPLKFPGTPDTGPGLTEAGRQLVRECNARHMLIDLSHITEKGFWDVAEISDAPLVASHSNVHAITPSPRNLTDQQLDCIREHDGLVGLNFATCFLRPDGRMDADTPVEVMVRHIDHLVDRLGEDRVGLGSDFDGAIVCADIADLGGYPVLMQAMRDKGYGETLINKIAHGNWLAVLERTGLA